MTQDAGETDASPSMVLSDEQVEGVVGGAPTHVALHFAHAGLGTIPDPTPATGWPRQPAPIGT